MTTAKTKKVIAVIPARGGSERIPNKNIVDFFGLPMIAWTIKAAQDNASICRIVVSTDSDLIAGVSRDFGVEVPFLRDIHCDSQAPVSLATIRAVEQAETYWNESYSTVVQLMPNCPLRGAKEIQSVLRYYADSNLGAIISTFQPPFVNVYWAMIQDEKKRLKSLFPEKRNQRSQDMDSIFLPTGAVWICEKAYLQANQSFYGEETGGFELDWRAAIDIDEPHELDLARLLAPQVLGADI